MGRSRGHISGGNLCLYKFFGQCFGFYKFTNQYRQDLKKLISRFKNYKISLVSGDNDAEKEVLLSMFPKGTQMRFFQTPEDKMEYIDLLQKRGEKVAMIGDGLNDSGALKQSDFGVAVADDVNVFTPASDAILWGYHFDKIGAFFRLSKISIRIIRLLFVVSLLYNLVGILLSVMGLMSPLVAAILMPASSISIVLISSVGVWFSFRKQI